MTLGTFEWTKDEDQHATAGPTWPGDGSTAGLIRFNLSRDSSLVALRNGVCHLVDPKTGESHQHWDTLNKAKPLAMDFTLDGKRVVIQYENETGRTRLQAWEQAGIWSEIRQLFLTLLNHEKRPHLETTIIDSTQVRAFGEGSVHDAAQMPCQVLRVIKIQLFDGL